MYHHYYLAFGAILDLQNSFKNSTEDFYVPSPSFPINMLYTHGKFVTPEKSTLWSLLFSCQVMSNSLQPHGPQCMLGSCVLHYHLPEFAQVRVHWVGDALSLILCHSLLFLPSIFPSIRVFSSESALCIRWPKYWRFSFSISPSQECSGLISFRINRFDLLSVQGTSSYQGVGASHTMWMMILTFIIWFR